MDDANDRNFAASNLITSSSSSSSSVPPHQSSSVSAKACAVVTDGDDSTASEAMLGIEDNVAGTPRNLPPDGTTFNQISLSEDDEGSSMSPAIPAYGYWNVQFSQRDAGYVEIDLDLPRGSSIGVYARKNALPTHTNYDIMEVVKGIVDANGGRSKRAVS